MEGTPVIHGWPGVSVELKVQEEKEQQGGEVRSTKGFFRALCALSKALPELTNKSIARDVLILRSYWRLI